MSKKRDENWADLVDQYTDLSSVHSALNEKSISDFEAQNNVSFKVFPKPQQTLDLHGMIASQAQSSAENFLAFTARQRLRTVRLIVGKGLHSKGQQAVLPGVIQKLLLNWKRQKKILGYKWEKGRGAVLVYLP